MIVGFTIKAGSVLDRKVVSEYLRSILILEDKMVADNIVSNSFVTDINVFCNSLDADVLSEQPMQAELIEVQNGEHLVVSAVDFKLEIPFNDELLILKPTEYRLLTRNDAEQFSWAVKNRLVKIIPEIFEGYDDWILYTGYWRDEGIWVDQAEWIDGYE